MIRDCLLKEIRFKTTRASGPGGQHVNKTDSRVELYWDLYESGCLTEAQKARLMDQLGNRVSSAGILILTCETHRSQHRNREDVMERFINLISRGLVKPKERRATRPTRVSVEKRLKEKKLRSDIKRSRGRSPEE